MRIKRNNDTIMLGEYLIYIIPSGSILDNEPRKTLTLETHLITNNGDALRSY